MTKTGTVKQTERFWLNSDARLFWFPDSDGKSVNVPCCEIPLIDIEGGRIIIVGELPQARELLNIQNGDTLEIANIRWSIPPNYQPQDVLIRLSNCRVVSRTMPDVIRLHPDKAGLIKMRMVLDCDVEVLVNEDD